MADELTCEVIEDLNRAEAVADEWDALADLVGAGPLVRPAYCLSWWRHLGPGRLVLGTVREGGRLVALAPLHGRRVGPIEVVRWLGHGLGTISEMLLLPDHDEAAALLWSTIATPRRVLDLVECRAESPALVPLTALAHGRRTTSVRPRDSCPVIDLEGDGLEHVRRPGGKNLRKLLKRADASLEAAGRVHHVRVAVTGEEFEGLLPDVRTVFDASEAAHPRQHLLAPPYEPFVLDYLRGEVDLGRAVALVGYVDEEPTSLLLATITPATSTLSLWISRYVPESEAFSPGHLLLRATYQWAARQGLARVDQLLGISQTKTQWTTSTYDTVDVRHGSASASSIVDTAVRAAALAGELRSRLR